MRVTFEREALFVEVWESPLTTLAKKYSPSAPVSAAPP